MKAFGVALMVLGLLALAYGGVSWTRKKTVIDAGPVQVTTDKHERVPIPPIAGGAALIAGLVLIVKSERT